MIESDLIRMRLGEGLRIARTMGHLRSKRPQFTSRQEAQVRQPSGTR